MKDALDFSTEIPHHEDIEAKMDVSITNYQDHNVMDIKVNDKRVSLTKKELETLLAIFNKYDEAQKIMKGEQI